MKEFELIRGWAADKNLHTPDRVHPQMTKLSEEIGELAKAVCRNDIAGIKDGIGDAVVVLTILAQQNGLTLEECVTSVWGIIRERTGKTVGGVFIKDGE